MMKWLKVFKIIWTYMNNKKTNTGTTTMLVGLCMIFLPMVGIEVNEEQLTQIITIIVSAGAALASTGLLHKLIKNGTQE